MGSASEGIAGRELADEATTARLLLEAARYLGETLEPQRVYERFREILSEAVDCSGVVVSSFDAGEALIRCDYAHVDGTMLDPATLPPLRYRSDGTGMQTQVIRSGESLLENDVAERVKDRGGTYYDVDGSGNVRKISASSSTPTRSAMMVPVKHEGAVVGVVQVMSDRRPYALPELRLVEGLVAQLGAAVRNARLHEAAQAETAARVRAEMERAQLAEAEAAARALAAEREHAAQVLEAVGDGVFLSDASSVVRFWNRAAEAITGVSTERAVGRPVEEVFAGWPAIAGEVAVAAEGATARPVTLPAEVAGRELWLSIVAVRSPRGIVYAFRDVTLEYLVETRKSEFIATVSHELRTPLTGVLGAAQTLLREDVALAPDLSRQLLEMIVSQATRLSDLTDELLLATRLDRGDVPLEARAIDVDALVDETLEAMQPRVPATMTLERRSGPGGSARADRHRVQQVLVNLIDNAIKYSNETGPVVVATKRLSNRVRVTVKDRGIGIDPHEQTLVFEKFYRSDPDLRRLPPGTGLGLYICRELVHRMGGAIGVTSTPGSGSTFYFDLPST
jgi:two-component system phosphate regulon sensor histidine kinase PhoR